jgi:hypothetical protein
MASPAASSTKWAIWGPIGIALVVAAIVVIIVLAVMVSRQQSSTCSASNAKVDPAAVTPAATWRKSTMPPYNRLAGAPLPPSGAPLTPSGAPLTPSSRTVAPDAPDAPPVPDAPMAPVENKHTGAPEDVRAASKAAQQQLHDRALQAHRGAHMHAHAVTQGVSRDTTGFGAAEAAQADGTGKLAPVLSAPAGDTLFHMAPTAIKHTSSGAEAFTDSTAAMAEFDPEGAAKINRALSLSGVPASFHYNELEAQQHKSTHMLRNMLLAGKVDPTVSEVLSAASPFTATAQQIRNAVLAQGSIDRSTVIATPLSKLYANPLWRPATPFPTMSALPQDGLTPGQQFAYQSLACSNTGAPLTTESY